MPNYEKLMPKEYLKNAEILDNNAETALLNAESLFSAFR